MTPQELTKKLHEEWLQHPVTQDVLRVILARADHYKKNLQEGILVSSNEPWEDKLRTSIETVKVVAEIGFNTKQFVEQLNKIK
jgi:hypothetical protein